MFCTLVLFFLLFTFSASADDLFVPFAYSSIQRAIDVAQPEDRVIVAPGVYIENIDFKGKNIIVRSEEPTNPEVTNTTIIDGDQNGPVVLFSGDEPATAELSGFTIQNGTGRLSGGANLGGGIAGRGTLATISYNVITSNTVQGNSARGGGISNCAGHIHHNTIADNVAGSLTETSGDSFGGGLYQCDGVIEFNTVRGNQAAPRDVHKSEGGGLYGCRGEVRDNVIELNVADNGGGLAQCTALISGNEILDNMARESGGGIWQCNETIIYNTIEGNHATINGGGIWGGLNGRVLNNLILENTAAINGGGIADCESSIQLNTIYGNSAEELGGGLYSCAELIANNIIWANTAETGPQLLDSSVPKNCCIQNWPSETQGNFADDPLLTNDFRLEPDSPCIDAGRPVIGVDADIDGEHRPSGLAFDVGIDEIPVSENWYFADGIMGDIFQTYLLAVNPSETQTAELGLIIYFETGTRADQDPIFIRDTAGPETRKTFNVVAILDQQGIDVQGTGAGIALQLVSLNEVPVFAERAVYWHPAVPLDRFFRGSGHGSVGSKNLATEWFLAEGTTTSGRNTFIPILNPNSRDAQLEVTFLVEGAPPVTRQITAKALRRTVVDPSQHVGEKNFSTQVTSTNGVPIIVERAMTGPAEGIPSMWSHSVLGVTETSDTWLFAEGATHDSFETFILLANPNNFAVDVQVRFLLASGEPVEKVVQVEANRRKTINVELDYPDEMTDQGGFSTEVKAPDGVGIVAERAMYWRTGSFVERSGATAVVGIPEPSSDWFLSEGAVWGQSSFETFILLGNPQSGPAAATVRFIEQDGNVTNVPVEIPAGRRVTVKANQFFSADQGTTSFSTIVESNAPIAVERAMYWSTNELIRIEGHASRGIVR